MPTIPLRDPRRVILLCAACVLLTAPAFALEVTEAMIAKFAPEIHLATYCYDGSGAGCDWSRPANIDWYLNTQDNSGGETRGASMRFQQSLANGVPPACVSDDSLASPGALNRSNLASSSWKDQQKGAFCVHTGQYYYPSQVYHSSLTRALFFLQPRKGSGSGSDYDKIHHGIYGGANGWKPSLFNTDGAGESVSSLEADGVYPDAPPAVGRWVIYAYVNTPSRFGGSADIQYWAFYAYDDAAAGFNHESDWEHVTVTLNSAGDPMSVFLSEHDNGTVFLPSTTQDCSTFRSQYTMKLNGASNYICLDVSTEDGGWHPIVYSADGTHAFYPQGCPGQQKWTGYAGGSDDITTCVGPVWKTWLTSGSSKNYEIVTDSTDWLQYAGLWGEIGSTDVTTGKRSPKWQSWGAEQENNPNGPR